jgi:protein SCO1
MVAGAAIALLGGCGGGGGTAASGQTGVPKGQSTASNPKYAGIAAAPAKPAPPLVLNDSLGRRVNIDQYRGEAVLVTFIYTHCPDVCPLIVGNLHTSLARLGADAGRVQVVAVSVDPRGDTPRTVRAFLRAHRMTDRMEYLIGSRPQLERVWRAWNILAKGPRTASSPDEVEHSALIYGISASGEITTLYPSNFSPSQVVHDVPILASE